MDEAVGIKSISEVTDIKELKFEMIFEYCKRNIADLEWLQNTMNPKEPAAEDGKTKKPTFIQLRKAFAEKYMPHLIPEKKEPKPTMYELVSAEYKRQLAEKIENQ